MGEREEARLTETFYDHGGGNGDPDLGHTTIGGYVYGVTRMRYEACDHYGCSARVVIDPECREQAERLDKAIRAAYSIAGNKSWTAPDASREMQAALRSLIAPPKPDEPTGLGAVVEDAEGKRWIRLHTHHDCNDWYAVKESQYQREDVMAEARRHYREIAAVEILSEGVQ